MICPPCATDHCEHCTITVADRGGRAMCDCPCCGMEVVTPCGVPAPLHDETWCIQCYAECGGPTA